MITVRPYIKYDGIPTFRDSEIKRIFRTMQLEGVAEKVFYNGEVKTEDQFFALMQKSYLLVALSVTEQVYGIGWINGIEGNMARAHFCMFESAKGIGTVEVGRMLLKHAFMTNIDMLVGYVPSSNTAAIGFAQKCGAEIAGRFPPGRYLRGKPEKENIGITILYYLKNEGNQDGQRRRQHDDDNG